MSGMALATGSPRTTYLIHRSTDFIFARQSSVHAPAASAVPLTRNINHQSQGREIADPLMIVHVHDR
jgi:hypothetical protein